MNRIDSYMIQAYKVDTAKDYEEEWVDANKLFCGQRLDIIAKWIYIDYLQYKTKYGDYLYEEHIKAMTKGSFIEANHTSKKGIESFIEDFKRLIKSIKTSGFQENFYPVPVDAENIILDGAHRVAACAYYNKKIKIIKIPIHSAVCYNADYFIKQGMKESDLDFIIQKYIELSPKEVFIANIWPSAAGKRKETEEIIKSMASIVYSKSAAFTYEGGFHYLQQVYNKDKWTGTVKDGYSGIYRKLEPCFKGGGYKKSSIDSKDMHKVTLYVLENTTNQQAIMLKKKIRAKYQLGKHSVHITDTKDEAIQMGQLVFNHNSIDFMNVGNPFKYKKNYSNLLEFLHDKEKENYLICGSTILSLFGICKSNDIDYLLLHKPTDKSEWRHSHNKYQVYFKNPIDDLFCNPNHYFYFSGIKCLSLDELRYFKVKRKEKKDIEDIKLIDDMHKKIQGNYSRKELWIRNGIVLKRRITGKLQGTLICLTHITGTYHLAKSLYHKWKGQV